MTVPRQAGAAETSPIGFGAGTAGGGASAVTVSSLDALRPAGTGNSPEVVKASGLIPLSCRAEAGSNGTVLASVRRPGRPVAGYRRRTPATSARAA